MWTSTNGLLAPLAAPNAGLPSFGVRAHRQALHLLKLAFELEVQDHVVRRFDELRGLADQLVDCVELAPSSRCGSQKRAQSIAPPTGRSTSSSPAICGVRVAGWHARRRMGPSRACASFLPTR